MSDVSLTGRSAELREVRILIGPGSKDTHRAPVMLGETGIGKNAILADLLRYAGARGWCLLVAAGRERESDPAVTGLRQLLRPVLPDLLTMLGRHAEELRAAIGMGTPTGRPDLSLAGPALPARTAHRARRPGRRDAAARC